MFLIYNLMKFYDIFNFAGKMARKIGKAGVIIDLIYLAENNQKDLRVDDLGKALASLENE